ncbi:MAG TPA: hypothetical protein DCM28_17460 [Phycisphaerales bacterium]|nr:hypothetical protein [Phycisphaerales bacterium]|tara:strand:- start:82927 stop:86247 length:3321 start_codon:yes stop_codon:yes gene_type:complete
MLRLLFVLLLGYSFCSSAMGQLLVYPKGMINSRVPQIANVSGGAQGKVFAAKGVMLGYDFDQTLGDTSQGTLALSWRCDLARAAKTPIVISDADTALAIQVTAASEGRKVQLAWMTPPKTQPRFSVNSTIRNVTSDAASTETWRDVLLTWDRKQVTLSLAGQVIGTLPTIRPFAPTQLWVNGWGVDALSLTGVWKLTLDWEKDYAARIWPAEDCSVMTFSAGLLGFDSFVVSSDPASRHYPMLQLNNPADTPQQVTATFTVKRELSGDPWQWQQTLTVKPMQTLLTPVRFPEKLGSDVYHLSCEVKIADREIPLENKHFLHAPLRDEPQAQHKFGLHDCDVRTFGFWPDALPIHIAHHYLRWGYVQGPGWVKDWDGRYGLDPSVPAEQWYWNNRIDWAIDSGRDMLVCVQSVPMSDWARVSAYPHMRVTPWGKIGGQPNDQRYRNFLREVARRYRGKVQTWEIENEPNAGNHTPADRIGDYVAVCKAVYEEIKAADPDARIMGISGTSKFQDFMNEVFKLGGAPYMDGVSWHTYTSPDTPDAVDLPAILKQSVDIVHQYKPGAPIWNSETGVYIVLRNEVDHAIPAQTVARKVRERDVSFVQNGWMGAAFDEWQGGACIVSNAVYNFLAGVEKYVFFGWNPDWPRNTQWQGKRTNFTLLSAAADGTRTPSLATLAVATLTTQMQGAIVKGANAVSLEGVRGGLFEKANGGKLAVIWSPGGKQSVMLKTNSKTLELVDMLGQKRNLKIVDGMAVCELSSLPIYVHDTSATLTVAPGPVEQIVIQPTDADRGLCQLTLRNQSDSTMLGTLTPAWLIGDGELSPASQAIHIEAGKTQVYTFKYKVTCDLEVIKQPKVCAIVTQQSDGGHMQFTTTAVIPTRPVVRAPMATQTVPWSNSQADWLASMKRANAKVMKLDRLDQVKLGHPPALASLHNPKWWGGAQELSAQISMAMDDKALTLYMDVLDVAARVPRSWPSVKGSVVELFFDMRQPGEGLSDPQYGRQTFQVLVKPTLQATVTQAPAWSPQLGEMNIQSISQYDAKTKRYWLAMRLPWSKVPGGVKQGQTFGFDVAINAAPAGGPGRKTQMILFGTASNAKSAADFGWIVPTR